MTDKSMKNKVIGKTKEVVGRVQKAAGDLTDDAELKAKGHKTEAQGKAQGKPESFFDKVKDTVSNAVTAVTDKVDEATHPDKNPTHSTRK
jgi:uncharacterized protein YjbJ (UPF0337 family)